MIQGKAVVIALATFVIGFGAGLVLRPVIMPISQTTALVVPPASTAAMSAPRGTQYFIAHIDEAKQVVAGCRDGSVRGGECATAEEAISKFDAEDRRKRFLGN
ncbi:hypothetical protein ACFB49_23010 [Sphingomonas sp. DBB INV C78]|uniref:hypothetical protein n=1 Tax=Sphingomonas sp. DBB INV C78 TaxID=3349434 RepID=UPI0036D42A43